MITIVATIRVKPGSEARAREILLALIAPTRNEPGCINYDLHQRADSPCTFLVYENWNSEPELNAHMQAAHVQRALGDIGPLLDGAPDMARFDMLSPRT
jgi:quinol monooxygenase YgiN